MLPLEQPCNWFDGCSETARLRVNFGSTDYVCSNDHSSGLEPLRVYDLDLAAVRQDGFVVLAVAYQGEGRVAVCYKKLTNYENNKPVVEFPMSAVGFVPEGAPEPARELVAV